MKLKILTLAIALAFVQTSTVSAIEFLPKTEILPKKEEPKLPEPLVVIVAKGDTLSKLAQTHSTTVQRLFNKNLNITSPDVILVGQKLTVPHNDEVLVERLPPVAPVRSPQGGSGNTYTRGYCTWHVKNMRPDLPNNLGNADTWYARAQAQGISTGIEPRIGAVGMTRAYMHVVYITGVNPNGTVSVSEMNYSGTPGGGFGRVSSRVAPISEFVYIY